MGKITQKTTVEVFSVLAAIPFVVWFIFYIASVDAKAAKGAEARDILYKIDKRLDRIEIKLGTKPEKEDE